MLDTVPALLPAGGVCHGATSLEAYTKLCEIVEDTVKTAQPIEKGSELGNHIPSCP